MNMNPPVPSKTPATDFALWDRCKAAAVHAALSLAVAACAAALVFLVWYPFPYRDISGGRELFTLVVSVDVVLGPLLTFAVFNRAKPLRELKRDLAVIVLLQLSGLAYGLNTVFLARPVHLVWELDRMRVVHSVDVPLDLLPKAPSELQSLPLGGPTVIAIRPFVNAAEKADVTLAALGGVDLGSRPDLWQPYAEALPRIRDSAQPVEPLLARKPADAETLRTALRDARVTEADVVWLPLVSRKAFWTVFLRRDTLMPVAYAPVDPY